MTIRPLGAGALRLRNVCAAAKLDCRLVPNQEIKPTRDLIRRHLDRHGYSHIEIMPMGGGDEWSQTSVKAPAVQSVVSVYKE